MLGGHPWNIPVKLFPNLSSLLEEEVTKRSPVLSSSGYLDLQIGTI